MQASGPLEDPNEGWPDGEDEEQSPANAAEQGPERGQATAVVGQSDAEREKHPACHVISNAGSQNGDTDTRAEEVQLGENAAEDGEGSDRKGCADEQSEDAKANSFVDVKLLVQTPGNGKAKAKGQDHAGHAYT